MVNLIIATLGLGIVIWLRGIENNTAIQKIIGSIIVGLAFIVNLLSSLGVVI